MMRVWPVSTPQRSNRRSILKPKFPDTYYPTDDEEDSPVFHHWSEWPERRPVDASSHPPHRPYTSIGIHRVPTPYLAVPGDIEDRPETVHPGYAFGGQEVLEKGSPLTYVPELNSWVTNASTDYEKTSACTVSKTMNRGMSSYQRSRSMSPMRTRPYFGRALTQTDGLYYPQPENLYGQTWNPYSSGFNHGENVSGMARHLEGATPMANYTMYPQSARESRPMGRYRRRASFSKDYVHDLSCFQSTQPMVTGHFIIHPDWVSERMTPRRKQTKKNQLQY
ncbi:uncharacterized protein LOC124149487 isoform X2 [Haliotis rufescens]|uniref:uncharacterized protein LOC124149487 isoform X2 n=1 Tax=Haliotis rufescens TaxID=6454 RepID=UPI001EAFCBB3|nr:uncharacterized protein LOC124149487 isoform X2 [Haliotis rufescens]